MLSVIIPVYNEEAAIEEVLKNVKIARAALLGAKLFDQVEIIIVNDGSTDATSEILQKTDGIKIIHSDKNRGYGASLAAGFREASGDFLAFLDGDSTYNPLELVGLSREMIEQNADMIIGDRMQPGSKMPFVRKISNKILQMIVNFALRARIGDAASGMRILKRDILRKAAPLPSGLDFAIIMTAKALRSKRVKIIEVPISYAARRGDSKLNVFVDGSRAFWGICKIALSAKDAP